MSLWQGSTCWQKNVKHFTLLKTGKQTERKGGTSLFHYPVQGHVTYGLKISHSSNLNLSPSPLPISLPLQPLSFKKNNSFLFYMSVLLHVHS